jgi:hypothetical protein
MNLGILSLKIKTKPKASITNNMPGKVSFVVMFKISPLLFNLFSSSLFSADALNIYIRFIWKTLYRFNRYVTKGYNITPTK